MDNIIVEVHGELESEFTKRIVSLIHSRIKERYKQDVSCESIKINLAVHECTAPEGFSIEDGDSGSINIAGNDFLGLIYGVGKFLHTSTFNPNAFIPSTWRGTSAPESKIRGVYFATHFFNWYQSASENEIFRYIEDLALWGINCIFLIYPSNKPISRNNDSSDIHQLYKFCRAAKALKLKVGILCEANRQFSEFSEEFWAVKSGQRQKGHLCPNIKEAKEDILRNYRNFLEKFSDIGLEYLCTWPYDAGGCHCEKCVPWGSNGYLMISKELTLLAREIFPDIKVILSTWDFEYDLVGDKGEWLGLSKAFVDGCDWVDYILADSVDDFPDYPLNHGVPGNLPLVNFPEISMWGLYPWGGFGANPLPKRMQRLWNEAKHILVGGIPYSEGIFDDINKVIAIQFYWEKDKHWENILKEYISYEYSSEALENILEIVRMIESSHTNAAMNIKPDLTAVEDTYKLAVKTDSKIPEWSRKSWRWRVLYLRTIIDNERYRYVHDNEWRKIKIEGWEWDWKKIMESSETAQVAMEELIDIYHARQNDNGEVQAHPHVRPPIKQ